MDGASSYPTASNISCSLTDSLDDGVIREKEREKMAAGRAEEAHTLFSRSCAHIKRSGSMRWHFHEDVEGDEHAGFSIFSVSRKTYDYSTTLFERTGLKLLQSSAIDQGRV